MSDLDAAIRFASVKNGPQLLRNFEVDSVLCELGYKDNITIRTIALLRDIAATEYELVQFGGPVVQHLTGKLKTAGTDIIKVAVMINSLKKGNEMLQEGLLTLKTMESGVIRDKLEQSCQNAISRTETV